MKKLSVLVAMLLSTPMAFAQKEMGKDAYEITQVLIQPEVVKCLKDLVKASDFILDSVEVDNDSDSEATIYHVMITQPNAIKFGNGVTTDQKRVLMVTKSAEVVQGADGKLEWRTRYTCQVAFTQ